MLDAFDARIDPNGQVRTIAASNDTVFAGGDFLRVNVGTASEAHRQNIAAFALDTA